MSGQGLHRRALIMLQGEPKRLLMLASVEPIEHFRQDNLGRCFITTVEPAYLLTLGEPRMIRERTSTTFLPVLRPPYG